MHGVLGGFVLVEVEYKLYSVVGMGGLYIRLDRVTMKRGLG